MTPPVFRPRAEDPAPEKFQAAPPACHSRSTYFITFPSPGARGAGEAQETDASRDRKAVDREDA